MEQKSLWDESSEQVPVKPVQKTEASFEEQLIEKPCKCIRGLTCIDEKTGLHSHPVLVDSQVERRLRNRMMELAETLNWPRISYWAANCTQVVGPGRATWHKYCIYGACGLIADVTGALERRMRGEPESRKHRQYEEYSEDE